MTDAKTIAIGNTILRGVVGSGAHGTAIAGHDDTDEMGIFIEPPDCVCGLKKLDHYQYRTQPEGVRSGPGDLDLILYSLRKFCKLASDGNPSVLMLLWLPDYIINTYLGVQLLHIRDSFVSLRAGYAYLGYLSSQKQKLLGMKSNKVNRPELIEKYGYDTKFAMHALRLGLQGIEFLTDRRISLPLKEPDLSACRAVRMGEVDFNEAIALIEDAEAKLEHICKTTTTVSGYADYERIDNFLTDAHLRYWKKLGYGD